MGIAEFIVSTRYVEYLNPRFPSEPEWRMFDTWAEAKREVANRVFDQQGLSAAAEAWADNTDLGGLSAGRSAGGAAIKSMQSTDFVARSIAGLVAWNAALLAQLIALGVPGPSRDHAILRWDVWKKGYGLIGDVEGILYVYRKAK